MGELGQMTQKALLPVRSQAILSHVLEHFGPSHRFVIAISLFGQDMRDYCQIMHPEYEIAWVEVNPSSGYGSGPGRSVLCCRQELSSAFYLVCSDTLWSENILGNEQGDWIGVAPIDPKTSEQYCNVQAEGTLAQGLIDKKRVTTESCLAFIGLAHIKNYDAFFNALQTTKASELSLAFGFNELIQRKVLHIRTIDTWKDTGTLEKYEQVAQTEGHSFSKTGEHFYHVKDRVAKFSIDLKSLQARFERGKKFEGLVPQQLKLTGRFMSYQFEPGKTLYEELTPVLFQELLQWLDHHLWSREIARGSKNFSEACHSFYFDKTQQRISNFCERYPGALEWNQRVCNEEVPSLSQLLKRVPGSELRQGLPVSFHGDLHPDNIIYHKPSHKFSLIDWRADFAGDANCGDLYYEFTKLRLGLELHLGEIRAGNFSLNEADPTNFIFKLPQVANSDAYIELLNHFMKKKGLDPDRIPILVALACINMAALHKAPYDRIIFQEGRRRLNLALGTR